ncbi:NAD kinase [Kineosporia sp. A_224]|uniref:NAD kinase n=1 Tax=Kineosporia sp. A_224 TaxID=1962180 RepID=UPI000B4B0C55|nr:NAD kinase [Kineosporia sp. A_224]
MSTEPRRVVVLPHMGRPAAVQAAADVVLGLHAAGLQPVFFGDEAGKLPEAAQAVVEIADAECPLDDAELVVVLGGDGTILRAAEVVRGSDVPLLGVNLGHVGFLAEAERDDLAETVERIAERRYEVEERMTLDVLVELDGREIGRTWAVNEASVEKANRERMIEVVLEVDGRPVTEFGCDGVVLATPTGSTAYAFSAGGPVVWPEVEALLIVPLSAHALFARPLVVAPTSVSAVELIPPSGGVLWCDGRRSLTLPPGARIEVCRSALPVRLARFARPPFTDRLVAKFGLPVRGWRGRSAAESRRTRVAEAAAAAAVDEQGDPSA